MALQVNGGPFRAGAINLKNGTALTITDDGAGNFTFANAMSLTAGPGIAVTGGPNYTISSTGGLTAGPGVTITGGPGSYTISSARPL